MWKVSDMLTKTRILAALLVALACSATTHAEDSALTDLSKATQELHTKISGALVRLKIETKPDVVLNETLRKEFEQWREREGMRGPGPENQGGPGGGGNRFERPGPGRDQRGPGGDRPEGMRRPPRPDSEPPATQPNMSPGGGAGGRERMMAAFLLRRFLEQGVAQNRWDPDTTARAQAAMQRLDAMRGGMSGETTGVLLDSEGHTLVSATLLRDTSTVKVIAADGSETSATIVGTHTGRPLSIIKITSVGETTPLEVSGARPAPGAVLLALDPHNSAMGFVVVPGNKPGSGRRGHDRFTLFGDERGPVLLFNANGQLAGIGSERLAVSGETLKREVDFILKNKKDLAPRQLGVKYAPLTAEMREKLKDRPGVLVESVVAGSPAEKAKLQKGDVVLSIDKQPLRHLPLIMADLAAREGVVPITILRDDQELTLELLLK